MYCESAGAAVAVITERDHGADLGVLYAAWWLSRAHGEDSYATTLLIEWCGRRGLPRMQALAHKEQYTFRRGFWTAAKAK